MTSNVAGVQLSASLDQIKKHYTVVVIGSGYGGAIAASRMARTDQQISVCVLERGREIRPGEYPNTLAAVINETSITINGRESTDNKTGMFDLRVDDDVSVLVGCGLGGTSLINANVALEADARVLGGEAWPQALRNPAVLAPYYERARQWLGSTAYPDNYPPLRKVAALKASAQAIKRDVQLPPLNVTFNPSSSINPFGVPQSPCILCGDCVTGCNAGAKNTTLMNYLPDAKDHGAEIFTEANVLFLQRVPAGPVSKSTWNVHIAGPAPKGEIVVAADIVILAAGTLGSTEILLRSSKNGLQVSERLGKSFSCNGDMLAFGYNNDRRPDATERRATRALPFTIPTGLVNDADQRPEVYGVGAGDQELPVAVSPGPCIAGLIDMRDTTQVEDGLVIEEGVIPGAFAAVLAPSFFLATAHSENFFEYADTSLRLQDAQETGNGILNDPAHLAEQAYRGPVARTQSYLVMSHDSANGTLCLDADEARVRVEWKGAGSEKVYAHDDHILRKVNRAIRGTYIPNPLSSEDLGKRVLTVHPLGGCAMADTGSQGVVNDQCQVFLDSSESKAVYENLYVCDGAVIPGSLAVNPLLTISAIAERACDLLAKQRSWQISLEPPVLTTPVKAPAEGTEPVEPPRAPWQDIRPKPQPAPPANGGWDPVVTTVLQDVANAIRGALEKISTRPVDDDVSRIQRDLGAWVGTDESAKTTAKADLIAVITALANEFPAPFSPSLAFTERMAGFFSNQELPEAQPKGQFITDPFAIARQYGEARNTAMEAVLTIKLGNLYSFVNDAKHEADIEGSVTCSSLSAKPMNASGKFTLFTPDPDHTETWNMGYSMDLQGDQGPYHFDGTKIIHRRPGSSWWKDLTTLFVTVSQAGKIVGRGIIELGLDDLIHQGQSVDPQKGQFLSDLYTALSKCGWWGLAKGFLEPYLNELDQELALFFGAKFAGFCAETVFKAYGGLLTDLMDFPSQEAAGRVRRPLQPSTVVPRVHSFLTADRVELQLTRYCDEGKSANGPVILAPGFGVRASSFAIDTVSTNLVEYLVNRGFDVWLFDYRASPTLTERTPPFTIDDIALQDWPAAIDYVYTVTGSKKPAVLAHCVGSMTLLMALLRNPGGIKDKVSKAICSQITLHPVTNWLNHFKSDLGVVRLLEDYFDVTHIDLRSSSNAASKAMDTWLWNVPVPQGEECTNPVCRRVFAVYGPSYAHDQLNAATHNALREMFGKIHGRPFEQMVHIVRKGRAVDSSGRDTYLTPANAKNLQLPLMFVAGGRNQIFQPETSQLTLAWLRTVNPEWTSLYRRHVFPDYAHMDLFIGRSAAEPGGVFEFFAKTLTDQRSAG